jgi:ribosome-associated protein
LAEDKKAEDIVVLDLRGISTFTDFFVLCSGTSEPHLKAINSGIREGLRERTGISPLSSEGTVASQWMVMDYSDVLIHIFQKQKREFYALESLWSDAPRLKLVS